MTSTSGTPGSTIRTPRPTLDDDAVRALRYARIRRRRRRAQHVLTRA
jgi:hypothetical protein